MENARFDLENGPDVVRLNFTRTILSDTGTWRCDICVVSAQDIVSNGYLIPLDISVIGTPIIRNIQLIIIGKYNIMLLAGTYYVHVNLLLIP